MAWCVCLMVYTALLACLDAMILLSPPDKQSVDMDVRRLKAKGISLSGLYSEDINSPYFQQLPLLDNDLDLQDMLIGNSLGEQSQFRTRTPVGGDSVFTETGDDIQNPYSVESEHLLQKHEKQFLVGTGDMGYGYVYANSEILPRGYRDISEESYENSIVDEEEYPPADNSANAQNDDVFEENDRDDNSSDDEWRIIKDEDFSKQVQRDQSFQDLIGLMKVSSTVQSETEETTRRYRRSSRSRRPAPNTASRVDHRTRSRGQRRRSRDKRRRARIGGRGRGEALKAEVEVLVVVENSIFRQFLASNYNNRQAALARLRRYYGIVVAMMDERFQTIEDRRLSISLSMSGMVIAETREDSGWLEKLVDWRGEAADGRASVNTDQALLDFSKWIKAKHKELPKFDHAMLFSGYQLTNRHGVPFAGKAYLNAICDVEHGNAVSIVADRGDFQCVKVATHELAHSLGSVHDGDPGFENCPYDSNYVMARVFSNELDTLRNAFYFSRCSIKQMKKLLRSKKAACVRDNPTVFYKYDLHRMPPGKIISPDQHCQRIYGSKSTFCNENEMKVKMCGQLWCRDPNQNNACRTNSYLTALPGTPCSQDKVMHQSHL
ncbi:A disintegrin and metalloproteinase with thrombospondin motifs 19-like [Littorina saxatilis]|uniref:A disintegrin and metalloproteinase with thrombospondin motifs 19-like n=1 Tax=Littorina saxatilis TaxID=31220 RepID=UPI0038B4DE77